MSYHATRLQCNVSSIHRIHISLLYLNCAKRDVLYESYCVTIQTEYKPSVAQSHNCFHYFHRFLIGTYSCRLSVSEAFSLVSASTKYTIVFAADISDDIHSKKWGHFLPHKCCRQRWQCKLKRHRISSISSCLFSLSSSGALTSIQLGSCQIFSSPQNCHLARWDYAFWKDIKHALLIGRNFFTKTFVFGVSVA